MLYADVSKGGEKMNPEQLEKVKRLLQGAAGRGDHLEPVEQACGLENVRTALLDGDSGEWIVADVMVRRKPTVSGDAVHLMSDEFIAFCVRCPPGTTIGGRNFVLAKGHPCVVVGSKKAAAPSGPSTGGPFARQPSWAGKIFTRLLGFIRRD